MRKSRTSFRLVCNQIQLHFGQTPQKIVARKFLFRQFVSSTKNNEIVSSESGSSSLSNYDEQYKALKNLDFMTAAKILFTKQSTEKKFGLDFHLVQLFFVCLPSLAVYLVAQYARSEMRKMDAELELKKQAEFEAQAKEMERKAAEEQAAVASNPELMEVKERLHKIEEAVKQIVGESKQKSVDSYRNKSQTTAEAKPDNISHKTKASKALNECPDASSVTHRSSDNQNVTKNGQSS